MSGIGISGAICKSAPCCRQITTPAPHHSVFYRPDALPDAQPTASKHWRRKDGARAYLIYLSLVLGHPDRLVQWSLVALTRFLAGKYPQTMMLMVLCGCYSNDHCRFADYDDVVWLLHQQSSLVCWLWQCYVAVSAMIIASLLIMMMLCGCYSNSQYRFADCDNVIWLLQQRSLLVCWLWQCYVAVAATIIACLLIVTMLCGCYSNSRCRFTDYDGVVWLLQQRSLPVCWLWCPSSCWLFSLSIVYASATRDRTCWTTRRPSFRTRLLATERHWSLTRSSMRKPRFVWIIRLLLWYTH